MKVHIENINININPSRQMPAPLLALLTMAQAAMPVPADEVVATAAKPAKAKSTTDIPAVGEKWPGTEAVYAGVSLSMNGDKLVHLLLWPNEMRDVTFEKAMEFAVKVNPKMMTSHAPTRHQSITLFNNLRDQFDINQGYWTMEKTESGEAAFPGLLPWHSGLRPRQQRVVCPCRQRDSALML